jgi:Zn-dependent M32 family carboxypeptidase
MTPYHQLDARFARPGSIHEAIAVLKWDYAAMMPAGGIEARQSQHVPARACSVPAARIVADATGFERHLATRYLRDT